MGSIPVIIDTDAGLDDLLAIGYLLAHTDIEVEAVTIAYGLAHVPAGGRNVSRLLAACGQDHIPVYLGRDQPLQPTAPFPSVWRHEADTLPGISLPTEFVAPRSESAESFLARRVKSSAHSVRILAIGALTNLAALTCDHGPALTEMVSMGGAFDVDGNLMTAPDFAEPNRTAEWNYFVDPLAAKSVLTSELPITVIPLDATRHVPVTRAFIERFPQATHGPGARVVSEVLSLLKPHADEGTYFAWDCLAAVYLTNPEVVRVSTTAIEVATTGAEVGTTRRSSRGPVKRMAHWADRQAFERLYAEAFA